MLLKVTDNQTIADLQDKFNECFPYLKLEFYTEAHGWKQGSNAADRIIETERIGNIRKIHYPKILDIKSWFRTGDVEQTFSNELGLNVQIYRADGNRWVQSTESDALTLKEQSEVAAASIEKQRIVIEESAEIFT